MPPTLETKLSLLSSSLSALEALLDPLIAQGLPETLTLLDSDSGGGADDSSDITSGGNPNANAKAARIQQAKLTTAVPYVVYDLIFIYLKTKGIDPKTHAVIGELDRIKEYFTKIQNASNPPPARKSEIDKAAASRFIKHAISQSQGQWKKTAAEEDSESESPKAGPSNSNSNSNSHSQPTSKAQPQTQAPVPSKITSKMLARAAYEAEVRAQDASEEDDAGLEIFVEDGDEDEDDSAMAVDQDQEPPKFYSNMDKGKGKRKDLESAVGSSTNMNTTTVVQSSSSSSSSPAKTSKNTRKRRRAAIDPFTGLEEPTASATQPPALAPADDSGSMLPPSPKKRKRSRTASASAPPGGGGGGGELESPGNVTSSPVPASASSVSPHKVKSKAKTKTKSKAKSTETSS